MTKDMLTITDNRTGKTYELPITNDTIRAMDLRQIKVNDDDFGMLTYDPAYKNTASCHSTITFIDGGKGILEYRGYPIEQLAEQSTFLEVAYLLLNGELPTQSELDAWVDDVTHHTLLHENIRQLIDGFRYDAHPMGMLISSTAALSTFYPEARNVDDRPWVRGLGHGLRPPPALPRASRYTRRAMGLPSVGAIRPRSL